MGYICNEQPGDWVEMIADIRVIYYYEKGNMFIDECGFTIPNIHREVSPNMVYLFMQKQQDMFVYGVNGDFIELIYEDDKEIH